jgi:hypothetical protein
MTLTDRDAVRLRMQDQPLIADDTYHGDGRATTFALPHRHLTSASAFIPAATGWSATAAAFDPSGSVSFSGVISANSAFRVRYVYSTFSDAEIDHFLAVGGGVDGAALEAVTALMFDGVKRAAWRAPDGTSYDDTAAMTHLRALYETLRAALADNATTAAAIESWSENQGDY